MSINARTESPSHGKEIIGYITNYDGWKSQASLVVPEQGCYCQLNVDFSKYTILNFAFFGLAKDGSLHSADGRNKNIFLQGQLQESSPLITTPYYNSYDTLILYGSTATSQQVDTDGLIKLAHAAGVKVMASIGGWSMSKHFCEVAADARKRSTFIDDCANLITTFGFDGIDIDWEYPNEMGMNIENYSDADYANFATLMAELRREIGTGNENGKVLITAAMSADPTNLAGYNWERLQASMDYFNIMTYDINGGWSDKAGHNSPLYNYPGAERSLSLDSTTQFLIEQGVERNKINLGVAFYGRGVITKDPAVLNGPTADKVQTTPQPGEEYFQPDGPIMSCGDFDNWGYWDATPFYSAIQQKTGGGTINGWNSHWDANAKVPYLTKDNYFLSYDNVRSIKEKAYYVVDEDLAGLIVWNVYGDMENMMESELVGHKNRLCPNRTNVLADAINEAFIIGNTRHLIQNR